MVNIVNIDSLDT